MVFQRAVTAWAAAHVLARRPLGRNLGAAATPVPDVLQAETGSGPDDLEIRFVDDPLALGLQCKTRLTLSERAGSEFRKTVGQITDYLPGDGSARDPEPRIAAIVVEHATATKTLVAFGRALRAFDGHGRWDEVLASLDAASRSALDCFAAHAVAADREAGRTPPEKTRLAMLARRTHVVTLALGLGGHDRREAAEALGRACFGADAAGAAPYDALLLHASSVVAGGLHVRREGLVEHLDHHGHPLLGAPGFDVDVGTLRRLCSNELARLAPRRHLPTLASSGAGTQAVRVVRDCEAAVAGAADGDGLFVTGEPGAGKSGVVLELAAARHEAGRPVVLLDAERHAGCTGIDALRADLGLVRPVVDVLVGWPGAGRGILVIDALDAVRGAPGEHALLELLRSVRQRAGHRWAIVVSIRLLDLRWGAGLRAVLPGRLGADAGRFQVEGLGDVRHLHVGALSNTELAALRAADGPVDALLGAATPGARALLSNLFLLGVARALLDEGVRAGEIIALGTSEALLARYVDTRLSDPAAHGHLAALLGAMVEARRASLPPHGIDPAALDGARATGLLAADGARIGFDHLVLFDYLVARFVLPADPEALVARLAGKLSHALFLAPAAARRMRLTWQAAPPSRAPAWSAVALAHDDPDVASTMKASLLLPAVDAVRTPQDVEGLWHVLDAVKDSSARASLIGRIAWGVRRALHRREGPVGSDLLLAWSRLVDRAIATGEPVGHHHATNLLATLEEIAPEGDPARKRLAGLACHLHDVSAKRHPPGDLPRALDLVAALFAEAPQDARSRLEGVLHPARIDAHGFEELFVVAERLTPIASADPGFAALLYWHAFHREVSGHDTRVAIGPSRLLALSSTRGQTMNLVRHALIEALPELLKRDPERGMRALLAVSWAPAAAGSGRPKRSDWIPVHAVTTGPGCPVTVVELDPLAQDWTTLDAASRSHEPDHLTAWTTYLRALDPDRFADLIAVIHRTGTTLAVLVRLLGVGVERSLSSAPLVELAHATATLPWAVARSAALTSLACLWRKIPVRDRARVERLLERPVMTGSGPTDPARDPLVRQFVHRVAWPDALRRVARIDRAPWAGHRGPVPVRRLSRVRPGRPGRAPGAPVGSRSRAGLGERFGDPARLVGPIAVPRAWPGSTAGSGAHAFVGPFLRELAASGPPFARARIWHGVRIRRSVSPAPSEFAHIDHVVDGPGPWRVRAALRDLHVACRDAGGTVGDVRATALDLVSGLDAGDFGSLEHASERLAWGAATRAIRRVVEDVESRAVDEDLEAAVIRGLELNYPSATEAAERGHGYSPDEDARINARGAIWTLARRPSKALVRSLPDLFDDALADPAAPVRQDVILNGVPAVEALGIDWRSGLLGWLEGEVDGPLRALAIGRYWPRLHDAAPARFDAVLRALDTGGHELAAETAGSVQALLWIESGHRPARDRLRVLAERPGKSLFALQGALRQANMRHEDDVRAASRGNPSASLVTDLVERAARCVDPAAGPEAKPAPPFGADDIDAAYALAGTAVMGLDNLVKSLVSGGGIPEDLLADPDTGAPSASRQLSDLIVELPEVALQHRLLRILTRLLVVDPAYCVDTSLGMLRGPALRCGLHLEAQAGRAVDEFCRACLVEHRALLDLGDRAEALEQVVATFAEAGHERLQELQLELPSLYA